VLNGGSRHRRVLEIGALVTCVLMVLLSATVIIAAQGRSQRSEVDKRMGATSALAAAYVAEQTTSLGTLVAAYADRPSLRDALQARPGDRAAAATFQALLGGLISARPGVTVTFVTDARGVALAVHPATPAAIGKNFAFRDWYGGALRTRGPYISEAYQSAAVGRPFVVAASTAVRSKATAAGPGRVLGILAATYSLSSFQKFVDGYAARTGIELLILDKRGVLIADGGNPPQPGAGLRERRAAGRRAIVGQGVVSAKTIDPGTGWTVVSEVPVEAALGPAASFRGVVLFAAALLVVLLVGGAGVGARVRRNHRTAEAAARENEERAQLERQRAREDVDRFFSLSLDLLCIASTDGYFKQINPAWKDVLGYETEELLGQPFASFIHPDDLDATSAEVVKLMGGASTTSFENRYRCRDGSYRWLLWKVSPLPDQGLMYAVARDNTERRRVEQAAARLAAIVDSSVDAIFGADLDGVVTSWNRGAEQIFGYRPDEIVGLSMDVLAPPGDDLQGDLLARAARGDIIASYEAPRVRRDGQLIDVSLTTSPVRDPGGAVIGISMIARDISESRRTAEALRAIIATASDGFISMDAGGLITEWNHRAEELFGWQRDEAIGRDLAALIIPESVREAHRAGLDRVLGGAGGGSKVSKVLDQLIEVSGVHRDGRQIPIELAVWRVQSGSVEQFSAFVRDISARQQIARDVATARDEALEASRLKSAFLATMSHEIRTPMNGVIGLTGLLLRGDLEATQRRYAEGIDVAGNALLAVINDVLDFSKIEAGALVLDDTAVNLGALLENVVELVSQSARSKGLELLGYCDPRLPTQLRGDPVRIRQILLNLATNAVKFTEQGEVYIHILPGSAPAGQVVATPAGPEQIAVRFEVTDTGLGIEDGDLTRLFEVFAQADASTTRKFGGTGLGLAICRELAEAMGGQVGVQSQPGRGSTFWCQIPLVNDPAGQSVPARLDASMQGRRVLVVVENDTNKLILAQQLSSWAMLPKVASGQEALDHLRDASVRGEFYDVAILDKDLSGIDGLDLAAQIQAFAGLPPIPIILVTSGEPVKTGRAHQAGVVACLTKPVQQSALYDCLVSVAAANIENEARRASAPVAAATPMAATPVAATHGHLLLVEDNEINQMVASGILTELGYTVDIANDGLEALELVERSAYRAVLMDCQMPNMDGYQATSELRRRESAAPQLDDHLDNPDSTLPRRVPIIAMTAAALKEDRDRCLAAGMDDYLTKPIQPDELAATMTRWTNAATTPAPQATTTAATSTEQAITNRLQVLRDTVPEPMVQKLVTSFLKRAPAYLTDLANALDRRDANALANTAHSFNGAASNLGASAVATLCDELETLGRNGGLQLAPDLLNRLRTEYEAARRTFQAVAHNQ